MTSRLRLPTHQPFPQPVSRKNEPMTGPLMGLDLLDDNAVEGQGSVTLNLELLPPTGKIEWEVDFGPGYGLGSGNQNQLMASYIIMNGSQMTGPGSGAGNATWGPVTQYGIAPGLPPDVVLPPPSPNPFVDQAGPQKPFVAETWNGDQITFGVQWGVLGAVTVQLVVAAYGHVWPSNTVLYRVVAQS